VLCFLAWAWGAQNSIDKRLILRLHFEDLQHCFQLPACACVHMSTSWCVHTVWILH